MKLVRLKVRKSAEQKEKIDLRKFDCHSRNKLAD
jgi:hypothetical protein